VLKTVTKLIEKRLQDSKLEYTVQKSDDIVRFSFNSGVSLNIYKYPKSFHFKVLYRDIQDFHTVVKSSDQISRKVNEIISNLCISLKYTDQKGGNDG